MIKFKISVIISAGNLENDKLVNHVTSTMNSIENQSMSLRNDVQVFMILPENEIANSIGNIYKKIYPNNYTVIYSSNVEAELPKCIKNSNSAYISIVNAGDIFSTQAFNVVYNYFEFAKGNVDVVGVKINLNDKVYFNYNKNFKNSPVNIHLLRESKAFPLVLSSLFIKTNVAKEKVKLQNNKFDNEVFMIDVLNRRNILGIAGNTVSISLSNTLNDETISINSFENILDILLEQMKRIDDENSFIPVYIQNLIALHLLNLLNNSEDIMGVYQHPDYNYSKIWSKFSKTLKYIDDNVIKSLTTTRFNKLFMLSNKYEKLCSFDVFYNDVAMYFNNTFTYNLSTFPVRFELANIENNKLIIEGLCHYPSCLDMSKLQIKADINGKLVDIEQVQRYTDRYFFEKTYLYEKGFKIEIPLTEEHFEIQLVSIVDGKKCYNKTPEFMEICSIGNEVNGNYYYKDGYALSVNDSVLVCEKCNEETQAELEVVFQDEIREIEPERADEIIDIRNYYWANYDKKEKQIWLIMDRPDRADDNAEAFFRYMINRNEPDIDLYFLISRKSDTFKELSNIGNVIEPFSEEHKKLFTVADYIISSQLASFVYNPFNDDLKYFRGLFRNPKHIFLQHGVTHNHNGSIFSNYRRNFFGFVTSANSEYNYLLEKQFHYTNDNVWLTGMPRFDLLYSDDKRKITIMPTWRKFLTTRVYDENAETLIWKVNDDFVDSEYFNFYNNLINSKTLLDAADKYGYKICFMPHVTFLKLSDKFTKNDRIVIYEYEKSYREVYAESSLLITDYSSAVFDFSYMRKPIIYCQFDKEKFYSNHTVKKGYFDFERDGFGEVTYNLEDTINQIIDYMKNNCKLKEKYKKRIDNFFKFSDRKCCERIYNQIKLSEHSNNT